MEPARAEPELETTQFGHYHLAVLLSLTGHHSRDYHITILKLNLNNGYHHVPIWTKHQYPEVVSFVTNISDGLFV